MSRLVGRARRFAAEPHHGVTVLALHWRRARFRALSTHPSVHRDAVTTGAVLAVGAGRISVKGSHLGYWPSPHALTGCVHLEARHPGSIIEIGPGSFVNNGTTIISEGPGVFVGRDVLIGPCVTIVDSDFHPLAASRRSAEPPRMAAVRVGDGSFIGASAIVLRG